MYLVCVIYRLLITLQIYAGHRRRAVDYTVRRLLLHAGESALADPQGAGGRGEDGKRVFHVHFPLPDVRTPFIYLHRSLPSLIPSKCFA